MTGAARALLPEFDKTAGLPGLVAPQAENIVSTVSTMTPAAGAATAGRFVASRAMSIDRIAFEITTADATNPAVDVGIYTTDGIILALVASSGSTAGKANAMGVQTVMLSAPYTVAPGRVYFAAVACAGTPTFRCLTFGSTTHMAIFGGAAGLLDRYVALGRGGSNVPLSTGSSAWGANNCPLLAVRES
jgi:hypothetical protein